MSCKHLGCQPIFENSWHQVKPRINQEGLICTLWLKYMFLFVYPYMIPMLILVISNYTTWPVLKHCRPGNGFSSKCAEEVNKENPISFNLMIGRTSWSKFIFTISRSTSFSLGAHADSADWAPSSPVSKTALSWIGAPSRYMDKDHIGRLTICKWNIF